MTPPATSATAPTIAGAVPIKLRINGKEPQPSHRPARDAAGLHP
jgi:hypothetical protein